MGRTVFAAPVPGDKELPAMLTLANSLALPCGEYGVGKVGTSGQIIHLGGEPGCFFLPIDHHPVGVTDEKLPVGDTLYELKIEVQQGQGQGAGRDGPGGLAGPTHSLIMYHVGHIIVSVLAERHKPLSVPGGVCGGDNALPYRETVSLHKGQKGVNNGPALLGVSGEEVPMQPKLSVPEGEHLVGDTVFQKRLAVRHRRPNSYRIQKKAVHILEVVIAAGGLAALRDEVQETLSFCQGIPATPWDNPGEVSKI